MSVRRSITIRRGAFAIAVAAALVSGVGSADVARAGVQPASNTVIVHKSVVGTAPAGTTFAVSLSCHLTSNPGAPETIIVHFDATGQPTDTNAVHPAAGTDCTVTETVDGGATTTAYQCAFTPGATDPNGTLGSCGSATGNTVHFGDVIGDSATVTVVNTFVPATTTTQTAPPAPPAPPVAGVSPAVTG
jgi:hypothetical protein